MFCRGTALFTPQGSALAHDGPITQSMRMSLQAQSVPSPVMWRIYSVACAEA